MKNKTSNWLIWSLLIQGFCWASCASLLGVADPGAGQMPLPEESYLQNDPVQFTVLQLNDVYEIAPLGKGKTGGLARVATIRNQLLAENYNLFTVIAGDFLSPSLLGTLKYEDKSIKGRQMVEVLNELGVGLCVFGNHEFDLKEGELQERLNESYFDWLGTNVQHQHGSKIEPFYKESYDFKYFLPETYVWQVENYVTGVPLRIGFYGATTSDNQQPYVYYEDAFQEATKGYLELLNASDVVLGLTHLTIQHDMKLASMLPKTTLILGGHEHENSIDTIGNVIIAKADANAKTVYVHRFTYYPGTHEISVNSELVPITDQIQEDSAVAATVARWQGIMQQRIGEVVSDPDLVIFTAKEPLDGLEKSVRNHQTNLGGLIAASMAAAARQPVEAAFFNGGSIRIDDELEGDLTAVDIFRILPFGGSIYEVELKGSVLKKALEAGLENKGHGGYLQWFGIEYNEAAKSWKIGGKPLIESKSYRIATNQYVAEGKENRLDFFNIKNFVRWETAEDGDKDDLRSDIRKAVATHLKARNARR